MPGWITIPTNAPGAPIDKLLNDTIHRPSSRFYRASLLDGGRSLLYLAVAYRALHEPDGPGGFAAAAFCHLLPSGELDLHRCACTFFRFSFQRAGAVSESCCRAFASMNRRLFSSYVFLLLLLDHCTRKRIGQGEPPLPAAKTSSLLPGTRMTFRSSRPSKPEVTGSFHCACRAPRGDLNILPACWVAITAPTGNTRFLPPQAFPFYGRFSMPMFRFWICTSRRRSEQKFCTNIMDDLWTLFDKQGRYMKVQAHVHEVQVHSVVQLFDFVVQMNVQERSQFLHSNCKAYMAWEGGIYVQIYDTRFSRSCRS